MVLGSRAFARRLPDEFVPLGEFELQGFRASETAFGLRDE
jgi:adenylate cyclase